MPRRTLPPRPKPVPRQEHGATSPAPSPPGDADGGEPPELLLPAAVRALAPLVLAEGPRPRPQGNKFQRLRQTVARRLSSLDAAWLRRCQGEPGPEEQPDRGAEPRGAELRGVEGESVAPAGIRTPPQEPEVSEGARGELAGTEGGERPAGSGGDTAAGPRGADGGRVPEELPGGAKKAGGKRRRRDSGAGGSEQPARKQPRKKAAPTPPENLLGDIEEEEEKKLGAPCRAAPARWVLEGAESPSLGAFRGDSLRRGARSLETCPEPGPGWCRLAPEHAGKRSREIFSSRCADNEQHPPSSLLDLNHFYFFIFLMEKNEFSVGFLSLRRSPAYRLQCLRGEGLVGSPPCAP